MGIDKARLVTTQRIKGSFVDRLNDEWLGQPMSPFYKISAPNLEGEPLTRADRIMVATHKEAEIPFYLQLNFAPSRKESPRNLVEVNPNNMPRGVRDLFRLLDSLFEGFDPALFKISRLDLNADVQLPVEQIFHSLCVSPKRKGECHLLSHMDGRTRAQFRPYLTGFYIGSSPALLRVYDKLAELRAKKKDVTGIPDPLTRVELELRHHKCPVRSLHEISSLVDVEPFCGLRFFRLSSPTAAGGQNKRRALLEDLVRRFGMHQAIRSLNGDRHFRRDYMDLLEPMPEVNELLQGAYLEGVKRFLRTE